MFPHSLLEQWTLYNFSKDEQLNALASVIYLKPKKCHHLFQN